MTNKSEILKILSLGRYCLLVDIANDLQLKPAAVLKEIKELKKQGYEIMQRMGPDGDEFLMKVAQPKLIEVMTDAVGVAIHNLRWIDGRIIEMQQERNEAARKLCQELTKADRKSVTVDGRVYEKICTTVEKIRIYKEKKK